MEKVPAGGTHEYTTLSQGFERPQSLLACVAKVQNRVANSPADVRHSREGAVVSSVLG